MPKLVWDRVGARGYESGLDRGVLYPPTGPAVPWNGLTSVVEKSDKEVSPVYYDGMKISEIITLGDFEASLSAVTYPDEFIELEGISNLRRGVYLGDQQPKRFGLCYRTMVGSDTLGEGSHYKIHVVYNVLATPNDKTYASISDDPEIVEFEWDLTAIPEETPGFRPTAHIIIDSKEIDPILLVEIERRLYGDFTTEAALVPMPELIEYLTDWYRVKIVDHGDGTWSAITDQPGFLEMVGDDMFMLANVNAQFVDDNTYVISDTSDAQDSVELEVHDNGDGTWTASTSNENLIVMVSEDQFELRNVEFVFISEDMYRLVQTPNT